MVSILIDLVFVSIPWIIIGEIGIIVGIVMRMIANVMPSNLIIYYTWSN
jgi:hypothetical protein